ncbi:hypothetical protein EZS27_007591 [termite gut metagenome]|uniref:Uncharacterized protein n=1 Tax=termite gut metagenome TaxID=433724 RepID=A0A5J4SHU2_9ZZZZ
MYYLLTCKYLLLFFGANFYNHFYVYECFGIYEIYLYL